MPEKRAVHIIAWRRLREFAEAHPADASLSRTLGEWFEFVESVRWRNFADVRADFPHADLAHGKFIFNVGGNKYRLITRIMFEAGKVYVLAVLTHKEYDGRKWTDL